MSLDSELRVLVEQCVDASLADLPEQLQQLRAGQQEILRRLGSSPTPDPDPDPEPEPDPDPPAGGEVRPLDERPVDVVPLLADWTITLPIGKPGTKDSPWNDYPDRMPDGRMPGMFYAGLYRGRRCVVFEVSNPSAGVTTEHSNYPRSEARGMKPGQRWEEVAYPSSRPTVITVDAAILVDQLVTRKRASGVQVHGGDDDVWQVIADEQGRLGVSYNDGDGWLTLREDYRGEWFRLVARNDQNGRCTFSLDGSPAAGGFTAKGSGWFPKVGAYLQTGGRSKYTEPATAVGRVLVAALDVQPRD